MIEFSGIEHAIDTPVKRYSSGMLARLGFSVATHIDADVVLVDEVLAVGDIEFQRRSLERLAKLNEGGVTTVIVSHNLAAVSHLCTRVMRLDAGRLVAEGDPESVITDYGGIMAITNAGIGRIPVQLVALNVEPSVLHPTEPFTIEAEIQVARAMPRGRLRLVLHPTPELLAAHGQEISSDEAAMVRILDLPVPDHLLSQAGNWVLRGEVEEFPMFPGSYMFALELTEDPHDQVLDIVHTTVEVPGKSVRPEPLALPVKWDVVEGESRVQVDEVGDEAVGDTEVEEAEVGEAGVDGAHDTSDEVAG